MTQLDLTGPLQVFANLPGAEVQVIWKTLDPIQTHGGLRLIPDTTLDDCPKLDVICVPGGSGVMDLMEDPVVLAFLRVAGGEGDAMSARSAPARWCWAPPGCCAGRKATTHWAWTDLLVPFGAIPTKGRVVRDGNLFTGGGVTAGIDFALTMVAEIAGREAAESIQLGIEYAPAPPFNAGSPDTARPELVAAVRARLTRCARQREARVAKVAAALV